MKKRRRDEVLVHVDAFEDGPRAAGWLRRSGSGRNADLSFEYDESWLDRADRFDLEPGINPTAGEQRRAEGGLFGVFTDAAPDSWGRRLLQRRELQLAKRDGRTPRTLDEWDLLVGVNDTTRMGAVRLARPVDGAFVDEGPLGVPPKAELRDLEAAAERIDAGSPADSNELDRWLELLIAPGASLGGARPKATFQDAQNALWIAKFPAANDHRDIGAWEYVQTRLAARAGIEVPETDLLALGSGYRTFAARRFDRAGGRRVMYASAMTLLNERDHADSASYLDIAAAIERFGPRARVAIDADLAQLFRRVAFNAVAGHRDDHLRNHGFLHDGTGWRLAPAFDLNPIPDKDEHELTFDGKDATPDLDVIRSTAPLYRVREAEAAALIAEVTAAVASWRDVAREAGLSRNDLALMESAFRA